MYKAVTQGKFLETKETPGKPGMVMSDYNARLPILYLEESNSSNQATVQLDYSSSTIGLDFGPTGAPAIKKILLIPQSIWRYLEVIQSVQTRWTEL